MADYTGMMERRGIRASNATEEATVYFGLCLVVAALLVGLLEAMRGPHPPRDHPGPQRRCTRRWSQPISAARQARARRSASRPAGRYH